MSGIALVACVYFITVTIAEAQPPNSVAMEFDGETSYVEIQHSEELELREGGTVEAWIYISGTGHGSWPRIISKSHSINTDGGWELVLENAEQPRLTMGGSAQTLTERVLQSDRWHHIAVSFDGEDWVFFLDGEKIARYPENTLPPPDDSPLVIAEAAADAARGSRKFAGKIQEVRIWTTNRTHQEIRENMTRQLTGDEEGLVGYWPLNEGGGKYVEDLTRYNRRGLAVRTAWVPTFVSKLPDEKRVDPGRTITLGTGEFYEPRGEISFQWYFEGEAVENATDHFLEITDFEANNFGTYHYIVRDDERGATLVESRRINVKPVVDSPAAKKAALNHKSPRVRKIASEALTDQDILSRIAAEDENEHVRAAATRKLKPDSPAVEQIALTDESAEVRKNAVQHITNQEALIQIAAEDEDKAVRAAAVKKLAIDSPARKEIALNDENSRLREIAVENIANQDVLKRVAAEDNHETVRAAAVANITDQNFLLQIVNKDEHQAVRAAAVQCITDKDVLRKIAKEDDQEIVRTAANRKRDWPMWRYDAARGADTPVELAEDLYLQWTRELPEPRRAWPQQSDDVETLQFDVSYTPVAARGRVFVPSMVTDSVTAYSLRTGSEIWRYYADGPVRLAPAVWRGKVYFTSDDGHLYCVNAASGELEWKFRGGPNDRRLLGNTRLISFWYARTGPLVKEGTVYFTAGTWPNHGVFVHALDAETGEVEWTNDLAGEVSHRFDFAPQGYIAADQDSIFVAGGRSHGYSFNRQTGEAIRPIGGERYTGELGTGWMVNAVDGGESSMKTNFMLRSRTHELSDEINGEVFYKLAAADRLIVSTEDGRIMCFGPEKTDPSIYDYSPTELEPEGGRWADAAESMLEGRTDLGGYGLVLGAGTGKLVRELLARSEMHIIVVEPDSSRVRELRDELVGFGKYGRRAAVIEAEPSVFSVQPYLFELIVSEDAEAAGIVGSKPRLAGILDWLRPYSGRAWLGASREQAETMAGAAAEASVDQVSVETRPDHLFAERNGPLSGAGEWTHQWQGPDNTLTSQEERVQLPLGLLWFGGPTNHNILPRHARGPRAQVAGGRQIFLGPDNIAARCVYSGRELWEREFKGIGGPFDTTRHQAGVVWMGSPFVTLPDSVYLRYDGTIYRLDPATGDTLDKFAPPGRSADEIYDADTLIGLLGQRRGHKKALDWGHVSVRNDFLITTTEPHMFEGEAKGTLNSHSATSSRRLVVMNRYDGQVLWEREAVAGFRHNAIVSSDNTLFAVDGLSTGAVKRLARRGKQPEKDSKLLALDIETGEPRWSANSGKAGAYLIYIDEHDMLIEGGAYDIDTRRIEGVLPGEPKQVTARRAEDGKLLWEEADLKLPGMISGEKLISAYQGDSHAVSILTGERYERVEPHTGARSDWTYSRGGCTTANAGRHLIFSRDGVASFHDLKYDSGQSLFHGFRPGCTANLIAADGILNVLDYTRTCNCAYAHQTSLAMIYMPDDTSVQSWARGAGARPNPEEYGLNFGAPGRRVDVAGSGRTWHDRDGSRRRHPSAIVDAGDSLSWVLASAMEPPDTDADNSIRVDDLLAGEYTVRLHFAELDPEVKPGERVFDVLINGEKVLVEFDIAAAAGGPFRGVTRTGTIEVDHRVEIKLRPADGSKFVPLINGIELVHQ